MFNQRIYMNNLKFFLAILSLGLLLSCNSESKKNKTNKYSLYYGGDIVTMEGAEGSSVEAVVTEGSKIVFTGDLKTAKEKFEPAKEINLEGQTMMPGFIEQHLHPMLGALTLNMPVIAPEDWELPSKTWTAAKDKADYLTKLKAIFAEHKDSNKVFFSWGFHQMFHGDVNRNILDGISKEVPIALWHRSGHEFIVNSAFLNKYRITEKDINSKASEVAQKQINFKRGHFFENGAMTYLLPMIIGDLASPERLKAGLIQMVELLHQNGVTAYNEPGAQMDANMAKMYTEILGGSDVPMYSYFIYEGNTPLMGKGEQGLLDFEKTMLGLLPAEGKIKFLPKKVKFLHDGAIISQLMQMKDPYTDGHQGEWMLTPDLLEKGTKVFWDKGYQIHIHVNGDKGLESVISVIEKRMKENPRKDHRTVIVHFANSTDEQVKRLADLGCIISANPYYVTGFSEKFAQIGLGQERADAMVRLAPAEKLGVSISLHSDLPMGPADPLFLAWCAVTRKNVNGKVFRKDLALSKHAALKAITIDAAYSWSEEHNIGSIKVGKTANFTIIDKNPYKENDDRLKDINVLATVFEGKSYPIDKAKGKRSLK